MVARVKAQYDNTKCLLSGAAKGLKKMIKENSFSGV